ncbi:LacI family DNA-binding transcriptional regulator [Vibrio sp. VB16]|uniref:LacI family DNA-binding transcriptional regulator n=1 Tax=Vibrio sp. VB16 TaxID=2785746 RepID=UPI00189D9701|nr:LacI family DNA-binding transcriptional regulator [Vibrio sp. VB16]UGA54050.1 LacI family transcriptional regulator [Vibrio sp. VB16]
MSSIGIKDVAKFAGVSNATVSQVLTNKGRISDATRERVKEALDKLGYVYNQNAANLRQKKSNQVGFLVHDISNPFYGEMAASIARVLDKRDNMLFLSNTEDVLEKQEKFTKALIQNGSAGIIICATNDSPDSYFESLKAGKTPVILVTRHSDKEMNFVGTDNIVGGRMATEFLLELGHKRIAFVGGSVGTKNREHRIAGYTSALNKHEIDYDDAINFPTPADKESGVSAIELILQKHKDVTACVFYQDIIAIGAMEYLKANDIIAGKDISIISLDGTEDSMTLSPSLTSVSFSAKEMGEKAGQLLFDKIDGNSTDLEHIIIQPKLIIGESAGKAEF